MKGPNRRPKMNTAAIKAQALFNSFFNTMKPSREHAMFSASRMQSSKYKPHQGRQEMDRRVRQRAAGIIS